VICAVFPLELRGFTEQTLIAKSSAALMFAKPGEHFFVCRATGAELWGKAIMEQDCLLRFAQQIREMMAGACTDVAKEQLRVWVEEFEEQAAAPTSAASAEPAPK
jgi:hypothetical protein